MNPSPNSPQGTPQGPRPNSSPTGANISPSPNAPSTSNSSAPQHTQPSISGGCGTPPTPNIVPSPDPTNSASAPRGVPFDISNLNSNDANQGIPSKWNRAWLLLALSLVAFMFFFWAYGLGVRAQRPMPLGPVKSPNATPATVRVYVEGAVLRPGVYSLSTDARISDAITLAGGFSPEGDPAALNLAAFVQDGSKISVPRLVPTPSAQSPVTIPQPQLPPSTSSLPPSSQNPPTTSVSTSSNSTTKSDNTDFLRAHPLDLNTATKEELQQLPNVGPVMAERIITYRTINGRFKSVSDLDNIQGIGEKRLEALKDLVVVR